MFKLEASRSFRNRLYAGLRDETQPRSRTSALVFAPHPDDEVLGCGGTILLKKRVGTHVACVYMTDGSTSHRQFMPAEELRRVRMAEAVDATGLMGIPRTDVHFLGFEDSRVGSFRLQAVERVVALLQTYRPVEVFVPYRNDGVADHEDTYSIATEACRQSGLALEVCEYPVWAWNSWPWVSLQVAPNREFLRALSRAVRSACGWRLMRSFDVGICVRDVTAAKRKVLASYCSQMEVPPGVRGWPTLGQVSGGDFLSCFFDDFEVFCCTPLRGSQ
jgi:LmbE family N-acetylglucosaminyl deacetylase